MPLPLSQSQSLSSIDLNRFAKMRELTNQNRQAGAGTAAKEFEALFLKNMLKTMRASLPESSFFNSAGMRLYQDMFDQQITQDLVKHQSIGLADAIEKQLTQPESTQGEQIDYPLDKTTENWLKLRGIRPEARVVETVQMKVAETQLSHIEADQAPLSTLEVAEETKWLPESAEDFIETLWPFAKKAASALGMQPAVMLAQAALETGWGQHMIQKENGESALNLFGIKAQKAWQGDAAETLTSEYVRGQKTQETAAFRAYDSFQSGFDDYVAFIENNPRYEKAVANAHDAEAYTKALQEAGYATDPNYADKIISILKRPNFQQMIQQLDNINPKAGSNSADNQF